MENSEITHQYEISINALDQMYEISENYLKLNFTNNDWTHSEILKQFKQAHHTLHCILSNSEMSNIKGDRYVIDLILIGNLGRIIRNNYLNILYLKCNKPEIALKLKCWDFHTIKRKLDFIKNEDTSEFHHEVNLLEKEYKNLENYFNTQNFENKNNVLRGKDDKCLTLKEICNYYNFNLDKFKVDYEFLSQFSHSTAFANNFIELETISLSMLTSIYQKVTNFYLGVLTETIEHLMPNNNDLEELKENYNTVRNRYWSL